MRFFFSPVRIIRVYVIPSVYFRRSCARRSLHTRPKTAYTRVLRFVTGSRWFCAVRPSVFHRPPCVHIFIRSPQMRERHLSRYPLALFNVRRTIEASISYGKKKIIIIIYIRYAQLTASVATNPTAFIFGRRKSNLSAIYSCGYRASYPPPRRYRFHPTATLFFAPGMFSLARRLIIKWLLYYTARAQKQTHRRNFFNFRIS
jgi:hypothetical protein